MKKIFISHRSTDAKIVNIFKEFLILIGVPRENIFSSSSPGNDVKQDITDEVRNALHYSCINILLLSRDYYESAYCLNEMGIAWFLKDVPLIPIALPEINENTMIGFLGSNYKLRRIEADEDISYICDVIKAKLDIDISSTTFSSESKNLKEKYFKLITARGPKEIVSPDESALTDDEKILLYYICKKPVRKITESNIMHWINENELIDFNLENALTQFELSCKGIRQDDGFLLNYDYFAKTIKNANDIINDYETTIKHHTALSLDRFMDLLNNEHFSECDYLFIAYLIDENVSELYSQRQSKIQLDSIIKWERKNSLDNFLADNYLKCLNVFIGNSLIYESKWTSYGNLLLYSIKKSLKTYLFRNATSNRLLMSKIKRIKNKHIDDLPF